ncbi:flagellar hook-associated protein FlgK [Frigidibacter sp. MR17.24]|uniref:flagellar hook-associated protein FlgK n=1 Tax=Frigidibacter sp. MR17.24 TaxID=3127345 RepID=UPI0030131D35
MSLGAALANAVTGLTANSRAAEVISNNVSNALTPGYARRELQISTRSVGGATAGVKIDGIERLQNKLTLAALRSSTAAAAGAEVISTFYEKMESAFGLPGDANSLSGRYDAFDAALVAAMNDPASEAYMRTLADAAGDLALGFKTLADGIQAERLAADRQIATQVGQLNEALVNIADLNKQIQEMRLRSDDISALLDQRQLQIDRVASIVPIREIERQNGMVALYTTAGGVLLDGTPVEIEFSPVGVMVADTTLASGALSGLSIDGRSISVTGRGLYRGGSLEKLFQLRDQDAPALQSQLDALARDLVERFQDPTLDTTLTAGQAGLFTDGTGAFSATDEIGLSSRLRLNSLVDPSAGGELWRLRDGLGATAAGAPGNSTLLEALTDRLREVRLPASGDFLTAQKSAAELAAELLSQVSQERLSAEDRTAASNVRQSIAEQALARDGVDTDQEMQTLLTVQQAYAANARVIQALEELFDRLMEI